MGLAITETARVLDKVMDQKITQKMVFSCIAANFLGLCIEEQIDVLCEGNSQLGERAKRRLVEGDLPADTKRIVQKYQQARKGTAGSSKAKLA